MRDALAACARELGVAIPSVAQYEGWRAGSPTGVGAPTSAQLRSACGSWSKASSMLLDTPEADPTRRRLLVHGGRFTEEQALRAVRTFLAGLAGDEPPTISRYLEWAAVVPRDADGRTRVPCNESVLIRIFGSWNAALRAAGAERSRIQLRSRPRARRFSRDDAVAALRAAHADLGEPLGQTRYDDWVREIDRRRASEPDASISPAPTAHTVAKLFGGWRRAQTTVLGDGVLLSRRTRPDDYTREQLIALWRACMEHVGHPPSQQEYDAWRLIWMSHGDGSNSAPHSNTLIRRLGDGRWSGVAAALGEALPRSRGRRTEYVADELTEAWRECVTEVGHLPSQSEYDQWREARLMDDPTTRVPFSWTLVRRIGGGSWTAIGGPVSGNSGSGRIRSRPSYTDDELAAAWRACRDELGRPPRQDEYDGWRHSRLRLDPHGGSVPFSRTLLKRLGGGTWRGVGRALETGNGGGDGAP